MVDAAGEEVCDRLLSAVRVVREAGAGRNGEVVEHQEGGQVAETGRADGAAHDSTEAFGLFAREERGADFACGQLSWTGGGGSHVESGCCGLEAREEKCTCKGRGSGCADLGSLVCD